MRYKCRYIYIVLFIILLLLLFITVPLSYCDEEIYLFAGQIKEILILIPILINEGNFIRS